MLRRTLEPARPHGVIFHETLTRGYVLCVSPELTVPGHYVFGFYLRPDATGRVSRLGGNWPFVVDIETGECRRVAGRSEYDRLRGAQPPCGANTSD
jgi:hypothetical protein